MGITEGTAGVSSGGTVTKACKNCKHYFFDMELCEDVSTGELVDICSRRISNHGCKRVVWRVEADPITGEYFYMSLSAEHERRESCIVPARWYGLIKEKNTGMCGKEGQYYEAKD